MRKVVHPGVSWTWRTCASSAVDRVLVGFPRMSSGDDQCMCARFGAFGSSISLGWEWLRDGVWW